MNMPEVRVLYNRLKSSAKKRNIDFDLSITDMYEISYPLTCPILGMPLKFHRGTAKDDSYSVDRKDTSLGYSIDNIQIISNKANRIKNNASNDDLTKFVNYLTDL